MTSPQGRRRKTAGLRALVLVPVLAATGLLAPPARSAPPVPGTTAAVGTICHSALPPEADDTLGLIARGGPFPYRQDGSVFANRERILPSEPYGYYHEYTVKTPGAPTRGARRIVTAEGGTDYYTADHYRSFDAIDFGC